MLTSMDISSEDWREYEFAIMPSDDDSDANWLTLTYRIDSPVALYVRDGGTTHRVVDAEGVTHCAPAPGYFGCVLRWQSDPAVEF